MRMQCYLPWELAARLALLGFNYECRELWGRDAKQRRFKPPSSGTQKTFYDWELGEDREASRFFERIMRTGLLNDLNRAWKGRNVAAPTYDIVMDWFREVYNIDFIERPSIAATKKYVCDPVGPGFSNVRLEAKGGFYEARLACITYLSERVKAKEYPFTILNDVEFEEVNDDVCEVSPHD